MTLPWTTLLVHLPGHPAPTSPAYYVVERPLEPELDGTVLQLGQEIIDWGLAMPAIVRAHGDHEDVVLVPAEGQTATRTLSRSATASSSDEADGAHV